MSQLSCGSPTGSFTGDCPNKTRRERLETSASDYITDEIKRTLSMDLHKILTDVSTSSGEFSVGGILNLTVLREIIQSVPWRGMWGVRDVLYMRTLVPLDSVE